MKKTCISLLILAIITLSAVGCFKVEENEYEYLRLHIRANSNSETDQHIKYEIKDKVVEYLTSKIVDCDSCEKAEEMLNGELINIEKICDKILTENNFEYKSKAQIKTELFPTRTYEDVTLSEGFYRALIINLGSGKGDNWWCVVYPPLCFKKSGNYKYQSVIVSMIKSFFEKKG